MPGSRGGSRGGRHGYIVPGRKPVYEALRRRGASKAKAARIANVGKSHAQRSAMSRRGARTRARRRRKR